MILTCPSCGTQYVVKDGAIPKHGRQVRCASCKHSWHQDPEPSETGSEDETIAEAALIEPSTGPEAEERAYQEATLAAEDHSGEAAVEEPEAADEAEPPPGYTPIDPVAPPADGLVEATPTAPLPPPDYDEPAIVEEPPAAAPVEEPLDDDFRPFRYEADEAPRTRSPLLTILLVALLIAALAAAFWFLAPAEWKQRMGIAGAGETPLQLMMTHSDRQKLASGNELLAVSGRVINPTDENQDVPPIRAQLRSATGELVYSWTIAPPARTLPPGASATFNSAEVNVPAGGDELTITLGSVKT
ncbi:MAG: zinc-ribbon domain-containing protein [Sphingomicrobium sp.]